MGLVLAQARRRSSDPILGVPASQLYPKSWTTVVYARAKRNSKCRRSSAPWAKGPIVADGGRGGRRKAMPTPVRDLAMRLYPPSWRSLWPQDKPAPRRLRPMYGLVRLGVPATWSGPHKYEPTPAPAVRFRSCRTSRAGELIRATRGNKRILGTL